MVIARILVIEDETPIRKLIRDILTLENYEVIEAGNGERGLEMAFSRPPDLILCDVMMPGIDGYEVLKQLQKQGICERIPFIFLTAKATRADTRQGMNLGADDYIAKPFHEEDLLGAIEARLKKFGRIGRMGGQDRANSALAKDLNVALEKKQLSIYYQPQIQIKSQKIVGAEALLRWYHPDRGFISPGEFIPVAEETGAIDFLGRWVLLEACQQLKNWDRKGLILPRIAVNVSARQFERPHFYDCLVDTLESTGVAPERLELELTEGTLIANTEMAATKLNLIRELGIKVAIDDFGTGYSSMGYLQRFSFDTLKIDRVFVRDVNKNTKNGAIVRAIIMMARQLNLSVIAEGVETPAELEFLKKMNCDEVQGYLFGAPVPARILEELAADRLADKIDVPA